MTTTPTFTLETAGFDATMADDNPWVAVSTSFQVTSDGTLADDFGCLFTATPTGPSSTIYVAGGTAASWTACPLTYGQTYYWQAWFYTAYPLEVDTPLITCSYVTCHTKVMTLFVQRPAPDFTISPSPSVLTVTQGQTGRLDAVIQELNGFDDAVTVGLTGLPPQVTVAYTGAAGVMHMQLTVPATAPPGTYPLTISGSSGALSHATPVTLVVERMPAPVSTLAPVVYGSARVGGTLQVATGTWSGMAITYTYQWERCDPSGADCIAIAGATGPSYRVVAADRGATLTARVTATNPGGSDARLADPTASISAAIPTPKDSIAPVAKSKAKAKPKPKRKKATTPKKATKKKATKKSR